MSASKFQGADTEMSEKPTRKKEPFRIRNQGATGAPPVVYIHGAMGNKQIWLLLSRQMAKSLPDREHYLIDLPGHGDHLGQACESIADYAKSVVEFLDERNLEKATISGHSMGGATAQQLAIDFPERVHALILISTGARLGVAQPILQAIDADFDLAVSMMKGIVFGPEMEDTIAQVAVDQMKEAGREVSLKDFNACNIFDTVEQLKQIKAPAIVCCGQRDLLTSPKKNKDLADGLGCPYYEFKQAGHMLPIERSTELTKLITDFLKGNT